MKRAIRVRLGDEAHPVGILHYAQEGARERAAFEYAPEWLGALNASLGIPARLSDYAAARRVTADDIPRLVEIATADICHQTNPRPCTAEDFRRIFAESM